MNVRATTALISTFTGSTEAKFFLIKFLCRYPNGCDRISGIKALSDKLGFTKPVASRCIRELVGLNVLDEKRHEQGQKPFLTLVVPNELEELLAETRNKKRTKAINKNNNVEPVHAAHMNQLLEWGEVKIQNRRHQLTINKRIVLLLLFAYADEAGIVRGLSLHEISACTGLTLQGARSNISALIRNRYIRSSVPGGNFPGTLGKVASVYALDLTNSSYSKDIPRTVTFLFLSLYSGDDHFHESALLKQDISHIRTATKGFSEEREGILDIKKIHGVRAGKFAKFVHGRFSYSLQQRIQWEMYDIASRVIFTNSSKLDNYNSFLKNEIKSTLLIDFKTDDEDDEIVIDQGASILCEFVSDIVQRTEKLLAQLDITDLKARYLQILPKQKMDRFNLTLAIDIGLPSNAEGEQHQFREVHFDFQKAKVELVKEQADIPIDKLNQWGILTMPLEEPKLKEAPPKRSSSNFTSSQ